MIELYLLRHGRSRADDERRYEGRYDSPLTDTGRDQAKRRAREWVEKGLTFDKIICSSLSRANETASIVGTALGMDAEVDPAWMELDNGALAGLTREEGAARYPMPDFVSPYDRVAENGESRWELHCRAAMAVESIVHMGEGSYLVVSHGMLLNAALRTIVGAPPPVHFGGIRFALGDLGFVRLQYIPATNGWAIMELAPGLE